MYRYNLIVSGGTFDLLHKGHKDFLQFALSKSKKILLGLTSDRYIALQAKGTTQTFQERKKALVDFLKKEKVIERVAIAAIDTIYIPPAWDTLPIEAIIASAHTKWGADAINEKRVTQGERQLSIILAPFVYAQDGEPISATRVRNGVIDREGRLLIKPQWCKEGRILSESLRKKLQRPLDTLITDFPSWFRKNPHLDASKIITVGDVITKAFLTQGVKQHIAVVDLFVGRKKQFTTLYEHGFSGKEKIIQVKNPAGSLTASLMAAAKDVFSTFKQDKHVIIVVDGEEDLAVLPLLLASPLGFFIFYGQPKEGVVQINVSEESKQRARMFVEQFTPLSQVKHTRGH